jgi:hypothetical protein
MNSVQEKMSMMSVYPIKKNDNGVKKQMGLSNSEIRYLGKSNQKNTPKNALNNEW